jgi:hypothetical protein
MKKNRPTQQMLDIHRKDVKMDLLLLLHSGERIIVIDQTVAAVACHEMSWTT